jgi:hypothetical protein
MPDKFRKKADTELLHALACGATVEQAARKCGLSARTVYRRLREDDFRRQVQELKAEMVQRTAATLTAAGSEAVKTLLNLLQTNVAPVTRLGAARVVLELGVRLREAADFEQRLAALEERMAEEQETDNSRRRR